MLRRRRKAEKRLGEKKGQKKDVDVFAIVELYSEAGVVITLSTVGNITHWGLCKGKKG